MISPYAYAGMIEKPLQNGLYEKQQIIDVVLKEYRLDYDILKKVTRKAKIVAARQTIMYCMRMNDKSTTLKEIAEIFMKDHTTVLHNLHTVIKRIESNDNKFMPHYINIKKKLKIPGLL